MPHSFEIGDRAYYTTRDDSTYSEGYGFVVGVENDYFHDKYRTIRFSGDDGNTFTGSEEEFVPIPEFQEGDMVIHTYHLDPHADYYGVVGTVLSYLPDEGELSIHRFDLDKEFTGQDYEFTLLVPALYTVIQDDEYLDDPVHHPAHYRSPPNGIECIDVIQYFNFPVGSAIKYLWRHDLKGDPIENLQKAIQNIEFEIDRRQNP